MKSNILPSDSPTIVDVARLACVSRATAACVLGGYGSVGAGARELVLGVANSLAYQLNKLARSMATGRSKTIGLVIADIENLYFVRASGDNDAASEHGCNVILSTTNGMPRLSATQQGFCCKPL